MALAEKKKQQRKGHVASGCLYSKFARFPCQNRRAKRDSAVSPRGRGGKATNRWRCVTWCVVRGPKQWFGPSCELLAITILLFYLCHHKIGSSWIFPLCAIRSSISRLHCSALRYRRMYDKRLTNRIPDPTVGFMLFHVQSAEHAKLRLKCGFDCDIVSWIWKLGRGGYQL